MLVWLAWQHFAIACLPPVVSGCIHLGTLSPDTAGLEEAEAAPLVRQLADALATIHISQPFFQRLAADGEWLSASGQTARAATRRSVHIGGASGSSTAQRSFDSGVYVGQLLALRCGHNRNMAQGEKDVLQQQIESVLPRDAANEHAQEEHK